MTGVQLHSVTNISVYFNPGETYTIYVPVNMKNNGGFFPRKEPIKDQNGNLRALINGFYIENDEVGEISPVANKVAIKYKHNYPADNTIYFHSLTGEMCVISIGRVPVHDHSSIPMGGPAYGTYFSDTGSKKKMMEG
jgi:hypothetical protein